MIHSITSAQLVAIPGIISLEDDFALADSLSLVPYINGAFQSEMLMVFFCLNGHVQMKVGEEVVQLSMGDVYLCKPHQTIHQVLSSGDCETWVLFYSPHLVDQILPARQNLSKVLERGFCPLVHFGEGFPAESHKMMLEMLRQHALNPQLSFHSDSLYYLFGTLLFEVLNGCCVRQSDDDTSSSDIISDQVNRADTLFNLFLKLLNEDGGRHRTVNYYADLICVSSKHLSRVIKEKTGSSVLNVITQHAIRKIKIDLKLTDLPIQEIAYKYNFSNYSFFCQYIRKHLGESPQEYRRKIIMT